MSHVETGAVVRRLGPYANTAAARRAAHTFTETALIWERTAQTWQSEKYPLAYHVPADVLPAVGGLGPLR